MSVLGPAYERGIFLSEPPSQFAPRHAGAKLRAWTAWWSNDKYPIQWQIQYIIGLSFALTRQSPLT